jgi:hypothetical protein
MAHLARPRPRDAARKKLKSRIQGTIVARPRSVSPVSPQVDRLRVDQEIRQIFARGRTCLRERFAIPLFEATRPTGHALSLSNGSVSCPTGRTTRLHTRSYSPGVLRDDTRAASHTRRPPDSTPPLANPRSFTSRAPTQKPSFPHGTGIPEKSGRPQIATCLVLDGWQWNTGCTWMNRFRV